MLIAEMWALVVYLLNPVGEYPISVSVTPMPSHQACDDLSEALVMVHPSIPLPRPTRLGPGTILPICVLYPQPNG